MQAKQKIKLFLVDDDPVYLQMLEHTLSVSKYYEAAIKTFPSGEACIKALGENPDIVIVDYYLNSVNPHAMDGIELLRKIKKINKDFKVIMLSGQEKIDVAINYVNYGAFDYIVKNENGFIKTQNAIHNFVEHERLKKSAQQSKFFASLIIGLVIVIAMVLFLYK